MSSSISAVVVAYRSAVHLPRLLGDLEAQGVDEVIVVDNASPDDSADVVRASLPRATVIAMPRNDGFAAGVNAGVQVSTGDLLLLINPDVRLEVGALAGLRAAHERHPRAVLGPVVHDEHGRLLPTRRSLPSVWSFLGEEVLVPERARPGRWPQRLWARWRSYDIEQDAPVLSGVCLLIPRSAWEDAGPMDEGYFLYWEEVDWQLRARAAGHPTVLVPASRIRHVRAGSLGIHDARRAALLAAATRRYTSRHLNPLRRGVVEALLLVGQGARWGAWSVMGRRSAEAAARREQHAAWIAAFRGVRGT